MIFRHTVDNFRAAERNSIHSDTGKAVSAAFYGYYVTVQIRIDSRVGEGKVYFSYKTVAKSREEVVVRCKQIFIYAAKQNPCTKYASRWDGRILFQRNNIIIVFSYA